MLVVHFDQSHRASSARFDPLERMEVTGRPHVEGWRRTALRGHEQEGKLMSYDHTNYPQTSEMSPFYAREDVLDMERRFYLAMLDARRCGLEWFVIGIVKDDTPFTPTYFERQPRISVTGSVAGTCTESAIGYDDFIGGRHILAGHTRRVVVR